MRLKISAAILALLTMTATMTHAKDTGMNEQIAELRRLVRGKRVGMLTNPSGVGDDLRQTA